MSKSKKITAILNLLLFAGILVFINILSTYFNGSVDLTEEKRFTLTPATEQLLEGIDDPIYVRILLDGNFNKGFKRLQKATVEMLDDFRSRTGYLEYTFENPMEGPEKEVKERQLNLSKDGITPTRLSDKEGAEARTQIIYPWVIIHYKNRTRKVNLLEPQTSGENPEITINNSVSLLEYKLADAIKKIKANDPPVIAFTTGHGELNEKETVSLETDLRTYAATGRIVLDSTLQIAAEIDVLIVAKPKTEFSENDKFKIDQYIMNGGKVLWLLDRLNASLDSMNGKSFYVPLDYPLNLEDMLFRYGVKIEPNLVLDMEASRIPQVVGMQGDKPQFQLFRWFYHPLVTSRSDHPIVKNLDRVNLLFPSSLDTTVMTKTRIKKTVLLQSSPYTRTQFNPVRLNFQILQYEADATKFNKPSQPLAVLLEGEFASLYQNRVSSEKMDLLKKADLAYKELSVSTRMIVVSDGDIARNFVHPVSGETDPLGLNRYERYNFANALFLQNAIDYLLDNEGVIEARGKEVKLRLLDKVKAKEEKTKWQLINLGLPLLALTLFGIFYHFYRKRKYGTT